MNGHTLMMVAVLSVSAAVVALALVVVGLRCFMKQFHTGGFALVDTTWLVQLLLSVIFAQRALRPL